MIRGGGVISLYLTLWIFIQKEADSLEIVSLSSFINKSFKEMVTEFNLNDQRFNFGGGLDDHVLHYCYIEDIHLNQFVVRLDVVPVLLPKPWEKGYKEKKAVFRNT